MQLHIITNNYSENVNYDSGYKLVEKDINGRKYQGWEYM